MKRFFVAKISPSGKVIPSDNHYLIVNVNEPYASQVFELIKGQEQAKGTWDGANTFKEFVTELKGVTIDGS